MRNGQGQDIEIAPLLARVLAFLVDVLILMLLNLVLIGTLLASGAGDAAVFVAPIVVDAAYYIGFVAATSATPGKRALGLYIGTREGGAVTPDVAILRYLAYFVGAVVAVGTIVSIVLVLIDPRRRALHDRVAGTLVLVGRPPERRW